MSPYAVLSCYVSYENSFPVMNSFICTFCVCEHVCVLLNFQITIYWPVIYYFLFVCISQVVPSVSYVFIYLNSSVISILDDELVSAGQNEPVFCPKEVKCYHFIE